MPSAGDGDGKDNFDGQGRAFNQLPTPQAQVNAPSLV
jgi:hypothetical protein